MQPPSWDPPLIFEGGVPRPLSIKLREGNSGGRFVTGEANHTYPLPYPGRQRNYHLNEVSSGYEVMNSNEGIFHRSTPGYFLGPSGSGNYLSPLRGLERET
jgi:hypothetical protein